MTHSVKVFHITMTKQVHHTVTVRAYDQKQAEDLVRRAYDRGCFDGMKWEPFGIDHLKLRTVQLM